MSKRDERPFEDVIDGVKRSERDKDRFLGVARLDRQENKNRLSADQKAELIGTAIIVAGIFGFMGWMLAMFYIMR